jgi:predicted ATPase
VARLRLGLDLWEQRGSRVFRPICMAFLADAYSANGQTEFANATFETALKISRETGERWAEPEILRLQAELLAGENKHSPKVVTRLLENAMELAREQGSKSLELRAAMSLSRISSRKGKSNPIIKRLSDIYLTFDEGLNSADLVDAQALLTTAMR